MRERRPNRSNPTGQINGWKRYQNDYEAGLLAAERYDARAAELDDELAALRARATELETNIQAEPLPSTPTEEQLAALHVRLTEGVRSGDIAIRKALVAALIECIDVHDYDDIRPTFRLYDSDGANAVGAEAAVTPGPEDRLATGALFASRRLGWS